MYNLQNKESNLLDLCPSNGYKHVVKRFCELKMPQRVFSCETKQSQQKNSSIREPLVEVSNITEDLEITITLQACSLVTDRVTLVI